MQLPPQLPRVKIVYIPADTHESVEEWTLEVPEGKEVECLMNRLNKHFSNHSLSQAQRDAKRQALVQQLGKDVAAKLDESMLEAATSMQLVENISLLSNSREAGFVGVNMYTDDHAQAKQLSYNPRATSLANTCGKSLQVNGDAFLGRIFDNEDHFARMDFSMADMSSSAPWVAQAIEQAHKREKADNMKDFRKIAAASGVTVVNSGAGSITERQEEPQPLPQSKPQPQSKPLPMPPPPGEAAKQRGNAAVHRGDWKVAVLEYSQALVQATSEGRMKAAAHNNRALAHLKLGQWSEALADCNQVLAEDSGNVKALLRRAAAYEGLGQREAAADDCEVVLQAEAYNKEAAAVLLRLRPPAPPPAPQALAPEREGDTEAMSEGA